MRTPEEFAADMHAPMLSCDREDLIRARDAEVAEQARAEVLAEFDREDVAPFHGHGHTEPGYWRLVGPKHYQPLPEPPTDAEVQAIRERFGLTEPEP